MRSVIVSFLDLTADEMADIISSCDLWYRDTLANRESFRVLEADGRLRELVGEVSLFSEREEPKNVLKDVLQHYGSDTFDSAFSGPRDYIRISGLTYERIQEALRDDATVSMKKGDGGVVITSTKSEM